LARSALVRLRDQGPGVWLRPAVVRIAVVAALTALVVALAVLPGELRIVVNGQILPQERSHLFAPRDGRVTRVAVSDGEAVRAGELLLTLRDPVLELEIEKLVGELRTVREQRLSLRAIRGSEEQAGRSELERLRLSAEQQETQNRIAGLEEQLELLREEQARLQIRSPSDGVVQTWDVEGLLRGRPVSRGQRLMTVARPESGWELLLVIPDRQAGHVVDALDEARSLAVQFVTAGRPEDRRGATLQQLRETSESVRLGAVEAVGVLAKIPLDEPPERPRTGESVVATISCGSTPLGYALFHEAIDWLRTRFALLRESAGW
jgi:multidrug efflux pump subunit AcrA (membrane-fusion protein)